MLFREISVFVEMRDFILDTDFYIIKFLIDYYKAYGSMYDNLNHIKRKLLMTYGERSDRDIVEVLTQKRNFNPLYDLVDYNEAPEGFHLSLLDDTYNEILFSVDYMSNKYLKFTDFSNTLLPILKMNECKEITIYTPYDIPDYIEVLLANKFNSSKVNIITGDLEYILTSQKYDSYFIRNINSIVPIANIPRDDNRLDVVIPLYKCNISIDEDKEVICSPISMDDLETVHNIDLRGLPLPL